MEGDVCQSKGKRVGGKRRQVIDQFLKGQRLSGYARRFGQSFAVHINQQLRQ
jgi:hypothetical protein